MKHHIPLVPRVISASRRTDIPAFYMDWFMNQIQQGYFDIQNPYTKKISRISSHPDDVHTIVFWSKNYERFLQEHCADRLQSSGYRLFFHFTVNSESRILEPGVPPLDHRIRQMRQLTGLVDTRCVWWRFDPICMYEDPSGSVHDNLNDFQRIADSAANAEIHTCVVSFLDMYGKVRHRAAACGIQFHELSLNRRVELLLDMERILRTRGIRLFLCCEQKVAEALPPESEIRTSSCIPNDLLMQITKKPVSLRRDAGQRVHQGCGCRVSSDIGSYHLHPCYHNCLFCYANPASSPGAGCQ